MTAPIALPARLDLSTLPGALDPVCEAVRRRALAREKPLRHPDGPGAALPEVIVLDGSTLERFDSAALAALLVLQREAIAQGCRIRLEGMPKGLRTLASIYGLQDAFLDRQA